MKNSQLLFVCIASLLLLFGCKSPNSPDANYTSYLEYDNAKYELTQGFYTDVMSINNYRVFKIYLASKEFSRRSTASGLAGTGNALVFNLAISGMFNFLPVGTHSFDYIESFTGPNQFNFGHIYINKQIDNTGFDGKLNKGTITLTVKGDNQWAFDYSDVDSSGKTIKVHYEGGMTTAY